METKTCFSREEAAASVGIRLPVLDEFLKRSTDPLPSIRAGRRILIPVNSLTRWLDQEAQRQGEA